MYHALEDKDPEINWFVACYEDGGVRYSDRIFSGNVLEFRRDEFKFSIVPIHDKDTIDQTLYQ